eukprot:TRINITY_DN70054_c0_g1_i1.p1 TRINITY_DN70054_c0_g1~~TRINITY_DN70054_c0_g1_i1.p1  ORF type:complete len:791 (+),score=210.06 TRINITY_DN70054_c0_g1_i1:86-2458(+)
MPLCSCRCCCACLVVLVLLAATALGVAWFLTAPIREANLIVMAVNKGFETAANMMKELPMDRAESKAAVLTELQRVHSLCPEGPQSALAKRVSGTDFRTLFATMCSRVASTLGTWYHSAGNYSGAEAVLATASAWTPDHVTPWELRAAILDEQDKDPKGAMQLLEKGLKATEGAKPPAGWSDSPRWRLQLHLARLLAQHAPGDKRRVPLLRAVAKEQPESLQAIILLAEALHQSGDSSGALKAARAVKEGMKDDTPSPADYRVKYWTVLCDTESAEKVVLKAADGLVGAKAFRALRDCVTSLAHQGRFDIAEKVGVKGAEGAKNDANAWTEVAYLRMRRHRMDPQLSLTPAAAAMQRAMALTPPSEHVLQWRATLKTKKRPGPREQGRAPALPSHVRGLPQCPSVSSPPSAAAFAETLLGGMRPLLIKGAGTVLKEGADWSAQGLQRDPVAQQQMAVNFAAVGGVTHPFVNVTSTVGNRLTVIGEGIQALAERSGGAALEFVKRQGPGGAGLSAGVMAAARPPQSQMFLGDFARLAARRSGARPIFAPGEFEVFQPLLAADVQTPPYLQRVLSRKVAYQLSMAAGGVVQPLYFEALDKLAHIVSGERLVVFFPPSAYPDLAYGPLLEVDTARCCDGIQPFREPFTAGDEATRVSGADWVFGRSMLNLSSPSEQALDRIRAARQRGGACIARAQAGDALLLPAWWSQQMHITDGDDGLAISVDWMFRPTRDQEEVREDSFDGWGGWRKSSAGGAEDDDDDDEDRQRKAGRRQKKGAPASSFSPGGGADLDL